MGFCNFNDLITGGSLFPHKPIHKATWISPDISTENQIDHITIARKWRKLLLDVRVKRGADIHSDHQLMACCKGKDKKLGTEKVLTSEN